MLSNEKLYPIVTELFMRDLKLNISPVFIAQSYFAVPKNIRLNSQGDFFMNIPNKRKLRKITFNHSSDIEFQDFINLYKNVLQNHIFLVIDVTLTSDSSSHFKENILERI